MPSRTIPFSGLILSKSSSGITPIRALSRFSGWPDKKVVELGAKLFLPAWEKSNRTHGYLSGQVDPRDCFDAERMLKQALDIAPIAPNVDGGSRHPRGVPGD